MTTPTTQPLKWTTDEDRAIFRIKRDFPRYGVEEMGISDFIMTHGDIIVREIRAAVDAEREACAAIADDNGGAISPTASRIASEIRARDNH